MDHADPGFDRITGSGEVHCGAIDANLPGGRRVQAVEDVHQRALAGAVLAQERKDLATGDTQIHIVVGQYPGELLGDTREFKIHNVPSISASFAH